ncbi:MAG TPA: response regulator [Candidatus Brocadiaceae bacterium]|nr:response regulator [Candidatus Brocadiaceae bacterium]
MKKILVVDDSATSRLLFRMHFPKEYPATIEEANSFDSAIARAGEVQPDIIFLDYNMPGKNGIDVARRLIGSGSSAKFILFSANLQQCVLDDAQALGFAKIIEKPITKEKIASALKDIMP